MNTKLKLASDPGSLGKMTGNAIFQLGDDLAIGVSGQTLRARLHVTAEPSSIDYFARRTAIFPLRRQRQR